MGKKTPELDREDSTKDEPEPEWRKKHPRHPLDHTPDIHRTRDGENIFESCRLCDYIRTVPV